MKKLTCRKYLNQPNLTHEKLCTHAGHPLRAHCRDLTGEVVLAELAASRSNRRAYEEVNRLAQRVEENYNNR